MPQEFDRAKHLLKIGMNTRFKKFRIRRNCDLCGREYERIKSDIGKFCSHDCSNKSSGPELGRKRIGKYRTRRFINCKYCGEKFDVPICRIDKRITINGQIQNRQYCSKKCKYSGLRKSDNVKCKKHKLVLWRRIILKRDEYQCVLCGEIKTKLLQAAHIKSRNEYPELSYDINNGRALCLKCHAKESPEKIKNLILSNEKINKNIIFSKCFYCNELYYRKPSHKGKFCNQECYHKSKIGIPSWNKGITYSKELKNNISFGLIKYWQKRKCQKNLIGV